MPTPLDPRLLYHLHIIFESGSLSAAAEVLSVSQPTLSRAVSTLETQVGRQLMVRGRNGVVLTEAGILLAEQGRKIAYDLKQADDIVNALKSNSPPTIRMGVGPLLAQAAINDFVTGAMQAGRRASFDVQIGAARQLVSDLLHGHVDIAVMTTPTDMRVEHLRSLHIADDHIGLFAGPKSPFVGRNSPIDRGALASANWMAIDAAFGPTSSHENMLRKLDFPYVVPAIQFNMNIQGLVGALAISDALCFLPARLTRLMTKDTGVEEIPLAIKSETRQIAIWHAAAADLNSNLAETIRECRSFLTRRLADQTG
ncbi:MAG: LysR family transcriptional regulator [Pseudomonadota bacterium]|nr:LysR family transcriptional regulator [Pseudomonadota bacterium]